jgi:hypothetical protein
MNTENLLFDWQKDMVEWANRKDRMMTLKEKLTEIQAIYELKNEKDDFVSQSEARLIENEVNHPLTTARASLTKYGQELLQDKIDKLNIPLKDGFDF